MKKMESKTSSSNPKSHSSKSKNKHIQNIQNIFTTVYDDEFISFINELSLSIKSFYKSINPNFLTMKTLLNSPEFSELTLDNSNNINSSIQQTFSFIETSFTKFYQSAKIIFKKMKIYRNSKIENVIINQKNESPKKNNINISNNLSNKDGINVNGTNYSMEINNNDINNNAKIKIDKLKNENSILKKKIEMLEKKNKTISPNKIPKPIKFESNSNNQSKSNLLRNSHSKINNSITDDERNNSSSSLNQSLSFYDEKLKVFQKENEKYKKDLHKLSFEINRFLINFKQIKNLEIPEGLKSTLEKGKVTLSQLTANFLKKKYTK
jgi:hypothetical protein